MIKKSLFLAAFVSLALATSCSQEDLLASKLTSKEIGVNPSMGLKTRAVETTISNLGSFKVTAFQEGKSNYMNAVKYTSADGSAWTTDAGRFFWPVEGDLHFYAYAPDAPGQTGDLRLDKDAQTLTDFVPNTAAADQKDFVYAKSTGSAAQNGETGIDVNFQHALSEITIDAKNDNTAYTVEVTGVKLGNVITKGSFTFPSPSDAAASWTLSNETSDVGSYTTTWTAASTLGSSVSTLDATNVPFMIIPQQLAKADKASEKAYIALKVKITMQGGIVIHDGWSYVGINTNWEMGKQYAYTLDFSNGAGQDENGKQIISGATVNLNCAVTDWDGKSVAIPEPPKPINSNSLVMTLGDTQTAYGIDITRTNIFWLNSDVGDASNVIDDNTEWTAEVIWQDIPSRAINFCDAKGSSLSGDTYSGTGKAPLYVKSAGNIPGNVVIGIKKKGSSDYLWSWHLWITEEPQEIAGFMDRNLGATSATPSDGSKTYGLYYQFGRKDPFVANIDIYDINGTKLRTGANWRTTKVTFAETVNTPGSFYTFYNGVPSYDWVSPNNYASNRWNDITGASGKTFFDPCPPGWKLPEISAFSGFSTSTFTWDATNKGRTYNGNWFPAAGYRSNFDGNVSGQGSYGYYWSETPSSSSDGYDLSFYSNSVYPQYDDCRALGQSVRCVQE